MKAIGLQKKQRPSGQDPLVRSTSGFDGPMQPGIPPGLQPYSAIPPHMQGKVFILIISFDRKPSPNAKLQFRSSRRESIGHFKQRNRRTLHE